MEIYETFKSSRKENKSNGSGSRENKSYGGKNTGNIGKNYYNRSFGGAMSNRKYTKEQVAPHKKVGKPEKIKSTVPKKDNIPPLYPISNASSRKDYRTGYLNENIKNPPADYDKYYQPSQNIKKYINITNSNSNNDKNVNTNGNADAQGYGGYGYGYNDYNGINNGYNWYWGGYGIPNWYNPYYFGSYLPWMPPYTGETEEKIIYVNNENPQQPPPPPPQQHFNFMPFLVIIIVILFVMLLLK